MKFWSPRWWREPFAWLWLREKDATAAKERRWQDQYDVLSRHLEDAYAEAEQAKGERGFVEDELFDVKVERDELREQRDNAVAECVILRQRIDTLMDFCPSDLSELEP